tara:strand:+ start:2962 stop:3159 length:198 start_codon:yes stop_codon:yes gene_type:complete
MKYCKQSYKRGYVDGMYELKDKLLEEINEIYILEETNYYNGDKQDKVVKGWVECLKMIKHTLETK